MAFSPNGRLFSYNNKFLSAWDMRHLSLLVLYIIDENQGFRNALITSGFISTFFLSTNYLYA